MEAGRSHRDETLGGRLKKLLLRGKSDEELMTLWVESRREDRGEAAAFELLWDRHRRPSYAAAVRMCGANRALAEEVLQDAWLEVVRATRYQAGNFGGFIRTIVARKALDRLQAASTRQKDHPEEGEESLENIPSGEVDPARITEGRESVQKILDLVARLPDVQRVAWTLRYMEDLTFDEVANAMGTPTGTAKTRVRLANEALAGLLGDLQVEAKLKVEG
jgi:RNA polymerase sigma-70 factor (ECF subfamily)